jgi:hypothetical protein
LKLKSTDFQMMDANTASLITFNIMLLKEYGKDTYDAGSRIIKTQSGTGIKAFSWITDI